MASAFFTTPIAERQRRELERLARLPDDQMDHSDALEAEPSPANVEVGRFYRPIRE